MIRACLVALSCWVAVAAHGVIAASAPGLVLDAARTGAVTAPHEDDARVIERAGVSLDVRPTRAGATGTAARGPVPLLALPSTGQSPHVRCLDEHDVRAPSRMASVAARLVDLRRELLRARPGRHLGRLEAGPARTA